MEEVPGERLGTRRFFFAGYAYHLDMRVREIGIDNIYRCGSRTRSQCRGAVRVDGNSVRLVHPHDRHPPNPNIAEEARMRSDLMRLARETLRSYGDIYREVSLRYDPLVATVVSLRSVRSALERERARVRPAIPRNIVRLGELLRDYPLTHGVFRGIARGTDGLIALVFASVEMVPQRIHEVREIFINCVFTVSAAGTTPFRVLAIYIRATDVSFPIVYAVMEMSSEVLYVALWQFIFRLVPGLRNSLTTIFCDLEKDMVISIRSELPEVNINCNWFLYRQGLLRRWVGMVLTEAPQEVLWMTSALPLVPVVRFAEALNSIATVGDRMAHDHPNILQFLHYMRTEWLPLAHIIAVERSSMSTSDMCETFHRYIVGNIGGHYRNIWNWLEKLVNILASHDMDWYGDRPIMRRNIQLQVRETARIAQLQDNLSTGRVNINEFVLSVIDHRRRDIIASNINTVANQDNHYENNDAVAARVYFPMTRVNVDGAVVTAVAGEPPAVIVNMNIGRDVIEREDNDNDSEDANNSEPANIDDAAGQEIMSAFGSHEDTLPVSDNNDDELAHLLDYYNDLPNGDPYEPENEVENNRVFANIENQIAAGDERRNGIGNISNQEEIEDGIELGDERDQVINLDPATQDVGNNGGEAGNAMTLRPCYVCLGPHPQLVLLPCGHFGICEDCNVALLDRVCPVCRERIVSTNKVFFA